MSGGWIKDHKKELLAALAVGGGGALLLPGLLGAGAAAGASAGAAATGAAGAGAAEGASGTLMGLLGGMGSEQAAMLAAQNAGMGIGADIATLNAAATAGGGGAATPWGALGMMGGGLEKLGKANALTGGALFGGDKPAGVPASPATLGQVQPPVPSAPTPYEFYMSDEEKRKRMAAMARAKQMGLA